MQKYVELKNGVGPVNDWYEFCKKNQVPYIIVDKRTKYATVRWDYISFSSDKDEHIGENQDNYLDDLKAIFMKYCNSKSKYDIAGGLVDFHEIEVSKANAMAEELYDIAVKIVS